MKLIAISHFCRQALNINLCLSHCILFVVCFDIYFHVYILKSHSKNATVDNVSLQTASAICTDISQFYNEGQHSLWELICHYLGEIKIIHILGNIVKLFLVNMRDHKYQKH